MIRDGGLGRYVIRQLHGTFTRNRTPIVNTRVRLGPNLSEHLWRCHLRSDSHLRTFSPLFFNCPFGSCKINCILYSLRIFNVYIYSKDTHSTVKQMSTFPKAPRFHKSQIPTSKGFIPTTPLTAGPTRFIDHLHAQSSISSSEDRNESPSLKQHIHESDAGHTPHPHNSPYGVADLLVYSIYPLIILMRSPK